MTRAGVLFRIMEPHANGAAPWRRPAPGHGGFGSMPRRTLTVEQRFWAKVRKTDLCWIWEGGRNEHGYGSFNAYGRNHRAHRFAYELVVGPIPEGLQIDHLCRITYCVNPDHLEPVTARENSLRGFGVSGTNARKTHCIYGHPLEGDNLLVRRRGDRTCLICKHEQDRVWRMKNREELAQKKRDERKRRREERRQLKLPRPAPSGDRGGGA